MLARKEGTTMRLTDFMGWGEARRHSVHDLLTIKPPVSARPKEMNGYLYQPSLKLIWGSTFTTNPHPVSTPRMNLYSHPCTPNLLSTCSGSPFSWEAEPRWRPVLGFAQS